MIGLHLTSVPALIPILPAVHSLLVLLLLVGSGLVAGLWALRHPRAWSTLLWFVWSQKWSLLSLAAMLWLVGGLIGRAGSDRRAAIENTPPVLEDGHWPARGNDRRTGSTTDAIAPSQGAIQWVGGSGFTFYASPAVVGQRVYGVGFSGDSSRLFCWDARDGRQLWTRSSVGMRATFSSPVIDGTRLIVGEGLHHTADASLFLFDISTGQEGEPLARFPTRSHVEGTPIVAHSRVFFTAGDDGVYALDLRDFGVGRGATKPSSQSLPLRWHVPNERIPDAETAICYHDGRVFVGSGAGGEALVVLDAHTGREIRRIPFSSPVHGIPSIWGGSMYIGMGTADYVNYESSLGQISCIDLETLKVRWSVPLQGTLLGAAACDASGIVFGCTDGRVYAVDHGGDVSATWNSRSPILASVALTDETVLAVNQDGILYALNRRDLQPLWQVRLGEPGRYLSAPVAAHRCVFVGTPSGFLCIGDPAEDDDSGADDRTLPDQGAVLWRYPAGEVTQPPGLSPSTILLAGESDGRPVLTGLRRVAGRPPEAAWRRTLEASVVHPLATVGEIAVIALPHELLALDAPTGALLWRSTAATQSPMIIDGERIWVDIGRDGEPDWSAVALADGQSDERPQRERPPPVPPNDIVWLVEGGVLLVRRGSDSPPRVWCDLSQRGEISAPPVVDGEKVLVVLSDAELVALGAAEEQ